MTIDRAIEILNPEHREAYDSLETVKEACRMGMKALELQKPVRPHIVQSDGYTGKRRWAYCGMCGAGLRIAKGGQGCVLLEMRTGGRLAGGGTA